MVIKNMKSNLKVSKKEIKEVIKSKFKIIILFYLIGAVIVGISSHMHNKVKEDEKVFLYIGANFRINEKATTELEKIAQDYGLLEFSANTYYPDDMYYEATFHTVGANNSDLFILKEEQIAKYASSDIFEEIDVSKFAQPLSSSFAYVFYTYEDKEIGLHFKDDYYVLINASMQNKDRNMYYDMMKYIVKNGGEFNG